MLQNMSKLSTYLCCPLKREGFFLSEISFYTYYDEDVTVVIINQ